MEEKDQIRLLKGHIPFGIHESYSSTAKYVTFLRDPVERIISYYFFLKRRPNHPLHGFKQFNNKMSLQDFVLNMGHDKINNGQVTEIELHVK